MNLTRVATVAAGECIKQNVGIDRLTTLLQGYSHVSKHVVDRPSLIEWGIDGLAQLGGMIEPDNNGRFRATPVTFRNGGTAAHHSGIEDLLLRLYENGNFLTPDEWIAQFLWIHPFTDGNGRTAWVLHNLLSNSMDNPHPLPEFF